MTVAVCKPRQREAQILNGIITTLETTNNNQQTESN